MASIALAIGLGAAGLVGGGLLAASSKAKAPNSRNLGNELGNISNNYGQQLQMQKDLAKYQIRKLYPMMVNAEIKGANKTRMADTRDLNALGAGMQQAVGTINPAWQRSLGMMDQAAQSALTPTQLDTQLTTQALGAGPSELRLMLEQQAKDELANGRNLSPDEQRQVAEATRAAYGARGMTMSNPAMFAEALARDRFANQRLADRRQFAGGVIGLGLQEDSANRNFATTVDNMAAAKQANARGFLGQNVSLQQGAMGPVLGMFGQRSPVNIAAPAAILGSSASALSSVVNPLLAYGADLNNTNYNANAAANIANYNGRQAMAGSLMNFGGGLIGGGFSRLGQGGGRSPYGGGQNPEL